MDRTPAPILLGALYDFPQPDGGAAFEEALRLGLDEVAATGRIDRPVEIVGAQAAGLPSGSEHDVRRAFRVLDEAGVLLLVGPAISDNALVVEPLTAESRLPALNYTGGERTRGPWMFHYQVGSLEEEPPLLAHRMVERGLGRVAILADHSPVGRRYVESFEATRAVLDLEVTATSFVSPLTDDVRELVARLRGSGPDVLCYFGLGAATRAVSLALADLGWEVPVLANSALMFGYARPDWRDGYRGWEYVDTVADDNPVREALGRRDPHAAAGPIGCAAYDMGRLVGEALARSEHLTRAGLAEGLRSVKRLRAASGHGGTLMGFGVYDHAALKGPFLVLREWRDGRSVQVAR